MLSLTAARALIPPATPDSCSAPACHLQREPCPGSTIPVGALRDPDSRMHRLKVRVVKYLTLVDPFVVSAPQNGVSSTLPLIPEPVEHRVLLLKTVPVAPALVVYEIVGRNYCISPATQRPRLPPSCSPAFPQLPRNDLHTAQHGSRLSHASLNDCAATQRHTRPK